MHVGLKEGESAKVDSLLAIIGPKGTDVSNIAKNFKTDSISAKTEEVPKVVETPKVETKTKSKPIVTSSTVETSQNGRLFISPLAKKLAEEKGINVSQVKGSGENGRIIKKDVENYTPVAQKPVETVTAAPVPPTMSFTKTGEEKSRTDTGF